MTIIKNVCGFIKEKWECYIREWWVFHPALAFGAFVRPIIDLATTGQKYSMKEGVLLAFSFFAINLFFHIMWWYKNYLIEKEENRRKEARRKWESFE